jgi:isoquinoline 1-oxidoreductase beta subunit
MSKSGQAGLSRRSFLLGSAAIGTGLTVGVYLNRNDAPDLSAIPAEAAGRVKLDWVPQAYVHIGTDNRVTVYSKHTEMGQGIYTGLATIVAEELDAAWEQMQVDAAPANLELYENLSWGEQATGGSSSIAYSFDQLRQAGAATRAMLVGAAAAKWQVPSAEITVRNGVIRHDASSNSSQFGDLAELAAKGTVPETVKLKAIGKYTLANKTLRRVDVEDKTNGRAKYTQDFDLPGMRIAVVAHPPRYGGKVASFDASDAKAVAGVEDVFEVPSGVAVIANSFWTAQKAREQLSIKWDESGAFKMSSQEVIEQFRSIADTEGVLARDQGSFADGIASADKVLEAEFEFPFLSHAPIEPLNCIVRWSDNKCEVWNAAQQQTTDQNTAAEILGMPVEQVEIHTLMAGGAFGRRACEDYTREALHIAKKLGPNAPVKLMWSREDDMRAGNFRPLNFHRLQAGVDADGKVTAWQHKLVGQSIASQTVPQWIENGVDGMSVHGAHDWLYDIPNIRVETHSPELPIPVLWYRGVGATHTVYSVESFIDELAALAGREPLEFRLSMLQDQPRMAAVARLAAEKSDWGSALGSGRGRGIAICKLRGTYLAQVAETSVQDDNTFSVDRVVTAIDCGQVINPDIVRAQMEGGTGFGLSSVLSDAITLRDGYVEQSNFDTYPLLRINQMPDVEVHIVPSSESPSGVGELAPMAVGAAVANALHTVTGKRYRSLPILQAGSTTI